MTPAPTPMRVSAVIPTYNASARLRTTIESVLAQTEPPLEIIVVDDGSTDDTRQVCAAFGGAISYLAVENGGQQRARNLGARRASGEWIAFLDHDDLWQLAYLAELRAMHDCHTFDLAYCNSDTRWEQPPANRVPNGDRFTELAPDGYWANLGVDPASRWAVLERYDYRQFLVFHPVQPSVMTIRNDLFQALGGFDPRMRGSSAEDFEFALRAIRAARVGLIWRPLVTITRHPGNASVDGSKMAMDLVDCLRFAHEHHDLAPAERRALEAELQRRLPDAMDGAFTLRRFQALRDYRAMLSDAPGMKMKLKCGITRLPRPLARLCASALTR